MRKKAQTPDPKRIQIVTQFSPDLWLCLANLRENKGHDDCLPYQADLYAMARTLKPRKLNFIKLGSIWNDGWGGDSCFEPIRTEEAQKLIEQIKAECAKHQMYWNGKPFAEYDLNALCDEMAEIWTGNIKPDSPEADSTYVYVTDDKAVAYGGKNLFIFTTQKFAYND